MLQLSRWVLAGLDPVTSLLTFSLSQASSGSLVTDERYRPGGFPGLQQVCSPALCDPWWRRGRCYGATITMMAQTVVLRGHSSLVSPLCQEHKAGAATTG